MLLWMSILQNRFLRQMSFLHLFGVSPAIPHFFACFLALGASVVAPVWAAEDVQLYSVVGGNYEAARDALVEAIEAEGLVVGTVLPFSQMLRRTGGEGRVMPYHQAEIVQFCSGGLAWQMVEEAVEQLALCPLSIAVYSKAPNGEAVLAYRLPGDTTPGRRRSAEWLRRIAERAVELARMRW